MKNRWNAIDWVVLALALGIAVGGVRLGLKKPWRTTDREILVCTVRTAPFDKETRSLGVLPSNGDSVAVPADGKVIGRVLAVAVVPQNTLVSDGDALSLAPVADRYRAEITVRLELAERMVGNRRLAAGGTVDLICGKFFSAGCEILSVEVIGNAE